MLALRSSGSLVRCSGPDSFWVTADPFSIGIGGAACQQWTMWLTFAVFWALNMLIICHSGMNAIKRFENWAAPFLVVAFLVLMVYMIGEAGGLGPPMENPTPCAEFQELLGGSSGHADGEHRLLVHLVAQHADFTRFGRSQRDEVIGQTIWPAHLDDVSSRWLAFSPLRQRRSPLGRRSGVLPSQASWTTTAPHPPRGADARDTDHERCCQPCSPSSTSRTHGRSASASRQGGVITGILGILGDCGELVSSCSSKLHLRGWAPTAARRFRQHPHCPTGGSAGGTSSSRISTGPAASTTTPRAGTGSPWCRC